MKQINKSPSYLIRTPYSYCFRMIIPNDLQSYFGKKELRYSLKTGYLDIAKSKARHIAGHVQIRHRKNDFSYKDELPEIFPEAFDGLPKKTKQSELLPTPKEKPVPSLGKVIEELTATKVRHKQC